MNTRRKVYVRRGDPMKWKEIDFAALEINEPFILCEPDGTPVGHYVAASAVYQTDGVDTVVTNEVKP